MDKARAKSSQYFSLTVVVIVGFFALMLLDSYNFLLAHVFAEMFSIGVALVIFFISWNARDFYENGYFVFLGVAYLFVGGIDMLHTAAYKGMGVFPGTGADLPTQLWIFARYLESLSLLVAIYFLKKKVREHLVFFLYLVITGIVIFSIFKGLFPHCYIPGEGLTPFKKTSELVIVGILGITLFLMHRNRERFSRRVVVYLYGSLIATMTAEFAFITYIDVYDLSNLIGHYFKIISFYLIYRGVIVTGFRDPYAILLKELKQRNIELEQSRSELERAQRISSTMLDNIPEEISLIKRETLKVIDANRRFLDAYGLTKDTISRYTYRELTRAFAGDEEGKGRSDLPELIDAEETNRRVQVFSRPDGTEKYLDVSVWPVRKGTAPAQEFVYIGRDISEEKRTERLKQDMERIIRHDLKSPLNGIIGGSRILLDSGELSGRYRELLEALYESAQSVLRMVDRSLDLYKMEEGTYILRPEEFDICRVFKMIDGRWKDFRRDYDLKLDFVVEGRPMAEDTSFNIRAERQSMETLLSNLIDNALDASPKGGTVRVDVTTESGNVIFDIHNPGTIPPEIRDKFFERYATYGKNHGTGLGTYSALLIARAHGGTIHFTSDEKEGTHLLVKIPSQ